MRARTMFVLFSYVLTFFAGAVTAVVIIAPFRATPAKVRHESVPQAAIEEHADNATALMEHPERFGLARASRNDYLEFLRNYARGNRYADLRAPLPFGQFGLMFVAQRDITLTPDMGGPLTIIVPPGITIDRADTDDTMVCLLEQATGRTAGDCIITLFPDASLPELTVRPEAGPVLAPFLRRL